ncbi:MAG TPA: DUF6662 family protein [Acetobacteraceae bacterium]|nr:DUF6662 family protein [Acetobacteraceae bacterium]
MRRIDSHEEHRYAIATNSHLQVVMRIGLLGRGLAAAWKAGSAPTALALIVGGGSVALPAAVRADEPLFGYTYTTDLLPRGKWELEQWATTGLGQSRGDYKLLGLREEVEYGLTNNFQVALYANWFHVSANRNGVEGATGGPGVPESADPARPYSSTRFDSVSFESIWRLLSPYKDPIGLALYLEPTIGPGVKELEGKLILQKNFMDDRLVWAANLTVEPEWERQPGNPFVDPFDPEFHSRLEKATVLEFTTGLSYRFAPSWFAGLEFRNHNEFSGIGFAHPEHSAFFLGPNVHYAAERFWATLAVLPQLPFARAYNEAQRAVRVGGRIFGNEHPGLEIRLRVGWVF